MKKLSIVIFTIILTLLSSSCTGSGTGKIKNTAEPQTQSLRKLFPDTIKADKIYTAPQSGKYSENILLAGIQGLAAKTRKDQVYVNVGGDINYIKELKDDFGITQVESVKTVWDLLPIYKDIIKGYILYSNDGKNKDESINVATSLAGPLEALIVSGDIEQKVKDAGFKMLLDVQGKDQKWLLDQKQYMSKISDQLAIEQDPTIGMQLRDYAVFTNAACFFTLDQNLRGKFLERLKPNSPVFGWNSPEFRYKDMSSEGAFIAQVSDNQDFTIPSHNFNLSTLSGFKLDKYSQKVPLKPEVKAEKKHYVSFMMTDGDNISFLMNGYNTQAWYGSRYRGEFKMGWGVSPILIDVGSPALKYLYDKQTENDGFIAQVGGLGYMLPGRYEEKNLDEHLKILNDYMGREGLNIIQIVDENNFSNDTGKKMWEKYASQPNIDGMYYIGGPYHAFKGKILMFNGKPLISSRYSLWRGFDTPETLAAKLNKSLADPKYGESYSVVSVHAWYEVKEGKMGNAMYAVKQTVDLLDKSKVEVVTPQEMVQLIKNNFQKNLIN